MRLLPAPYHPTGRGRSREKNFFPLSCAFLQPRSRPRHLQGSDGSPEDPFTASALAADPAGAGAGAALLRPGSYVSPIPAAACGP